VIKQYADDLPEITDLGLERVLSNLLCNAIDAIEEEGEISIATRLKDDKIRIRIKDTGKGIPANSVEKIFEPFYTTKDIDKGCGLGLTIVSEIVKSYNGDIQVISEEGMGTTFTVSIPINEP
jgi:signal transduction histidine kinase